METKDIGKPSLWIPELDEAYLAVLGKCGEESGELTTAICRAIIQGVDGKDPKTGKTNIEQLEDEIADMRALCNLLSATLNLNENAMDLRTDAKLTMKMEWLAMLRKHREANPR